MSEQIYLVSDDEHYWAYSEEFASLEEAIAFGTEEFFGVTHFYTGTKGDTPVPTINLHDLEYLFEVKSEEYQTPNGECWPETSQQNISELAKSMTATLQAWLRRHDLMPKWYSVENIVKHTLPFQPTKDDLARMTLALSDDAQRKLYPELFDESKEERK